MIQQKAMCKAIRKDAITQLGLCIHFVTTMIITGVVSWHLFSNGVTGERLIALAVLSASSYINGSLSGIVSRKKDELMEVYKNE